MGDYLDFSSKVREGFPSRDQTKKIADRVKTEKERVAAENKQQALKAFNQDVERQYWSFREQVIKGIKTEGHRGYYSVHVYADVFKPQNRNDLAEVAKAAATRLIKTLHHYGYHAQSDYKPAWAANDMEHYSGPTVHFFVSWADATPRQPHF